MVIRITHLESIEMNLDTLPIRPFNDGFIRVATQQEIESGKVTFYGSMEVLARHHEDRVPAKVMEPRLQSHAIQSQLMELKPNKEAGKLVEIPIRLFFNKTDSALSASYLAYDADGKPMCAGDGTTAQRSDQTEQGHSVMVETACVGPEKCVYANSGTVQCRRQVSMTCQIVGQSDPLSVFEVRSSSFNAFNTLRAQLQLVEHRFGGLRHVPLKLQLWQKSCRASDLVAFDVFKLTLDAADEVAAMKSAVRSRQDETEAGLRQDIDSIFGKPSTMLLDDDFEAMKDFYRPLETTERRFGTVPVASRIVAQARVAGSGAAASFLASTMAVAEQGREKEHSLG